jgi:uncharacterized protein YutE (UPF0331/DUF86 family)
LLSRVENLEENIATLNLLQKKFTLEDIRKSRLDEWSLRYGLFESIQIVIDLSCHISSKYNLGISKTYAECIENLQSHHYIDEKLSNNLISAIGLRNLLIHEYIKIDIEQLYSFLKLTDDFSLFIKEIRDCL